jgi:alcohol dehydrogenase class IV
MFDINVVIAIGNSSAISTSKITKITAIKKNRDENGSRTEFLGSNPHSNGDLSSRSSLVIFEIDVISIII